MTCVRGCITQVALFSNNHFTENLLHRIITSWDVKFKTIWLKQKLFDFKIIRFSRISDVVRRKYKIKSQSNEINWVHLSHVDYFMFCQVFFSMWKLCCICCMGKVSPQSASSCVSEGDQKKCKRNCTGFTWKAFLLCASSSCAFSTQQL